MTTSYRRSLKAAKRSLEQLKTGRGDWVATLSLLDILDDSVDLTNGEQRLTAEHLRKEFQAMRREQMSATLAKVDHARSLL